MRGLAAVLATLALASLAATGTGATVASPCGRDSLRTAVGAFVSSFNAGDSLRLDALFADEPAFGWYSSGPPGLRTRAAAANRATLGAYFRSRHRRQDRLRLIAFRFTGNSPGYGNFTLVLKRSAADYRRGAWFRLVGKGAAICSDAPPEPVRFIVVSLGGPLRAGR
jgi:hypothetical protein